MRKPILLFSSALLLTLAACGPATVYDADRELPGFWVYADTLRFDYAIEDTSKRYDLFLTVEHSAEFSEQNMYVRFVTFLPNAKVDSQVVSLQLADRFGQWEGACDDERCEVSIALQTNTFYPEPGQYGLLAEQYGRKDSLAGIYAIGLEIIEATE